MKNENHPEKRVKLSEEGKRLIKERFDKVQEIQKKINEKQERFLLDRLEIDKSDFFKKKKLFDERNSILKHLDQFWAISICQNDEMVDRISYSDTDILENIINVKMDCVEKKFDEDEWIGYKLIFELRKNSHIENKELWKTILYSRTDSEKISIEQSGVKWIQKENKKDVEEEGKNGKVTGKKRKIEESKKTDKKESFFVFFEKETPQDQEIFMIFKEEIVLDPVVLFKSLVE